MVPAITVRGTTIATTRAEPARARVARAIETTGVHHVVALTGSTRLRAASAAAGAQPARTIAQGAATIATEQATGATAASVPPPGGTPARAVATCPDPAEATASATTAA